LKILQTPKEKRLTGSSYYFLDFTTEYTSSAGFFLCNRELAIPTEIFEEPGISAMIQFVHYLSSLWFDGMEAKSDRDHWLSFGLRQFLLSVYMEVFLEDKSISEKNWRDLHTYFLSLDDVSKDFEDYGCLSHGSIGGSRFRADSGAMNIKSLFIFHMLRNLFIDYNAAADKREVAFESMLREFYSTYKHSKYSVNDFRAILEKHFGAQLSWFFEQWVDGYEIPSYEFASKTVVNENGHYVVYCQVVQEDVSENFFMPVPVKVVFDDNSVYYTRAMIKGEKIKFEIGPFESEPKEVIFNPNYSVLSKTSSKSWEDDF
jgi:hypothetical protein